jgi:CheY-like chemotaxis protein
MSLPVPKTNRSIRALLIEDNREDAILIKIAFDKLNRGFHMTLIQDGQEAAVYLSGGEKQGAAPKPDIIFLDLNIPRMSGLEVLARIRADSAFDDTPVIILTGSDSKDHIRNAYDSRANFYVQKPQDMDGFLVVARHVEEIWLKGINQAAH